MAEFWSTFVAPDPVSRVFVSRGASGNPWIYAAASVCIAAAFVAISVVMLQVASKKKDFQFRWILILAGVFFGFRGLTQM